MAAVGHRGGGLSPAEVTAPCVPRASASSSNVPFWMPCLSSPRHLSSSLRKPASVIDGECPSRIHAVPPAAPSCPFTFVLCPQHGLSPGPQTASRMLGIRHQGGETWHHQCRCLHPASQALQLLPQGRAGGWDAGCKGGASPSGPQDYRRRPGCQPALKPHSPGMGGGCPSQGEAWTSTDHSRPGRYLSHCHSGLTLCQACAGPGKPQGKHLCLPTCAELTAQGRRPLADHPTKNDSTAV